MTTVNHDPRSPRAGATAERRGVPRLRFGYAVLLDRVGERGRGTLARTFTEEISASGLFVCTAPWAGLRHGQALEIRVTVPHRVATDGRETRLHLDGTGRVARIDPPSARGLYDEDGMERAGVAIVFDAPLAVDVGAHTFA